MSNLHTLLEKFELGDINIEQISKALDTEVQKVIGEDEEIYDVAKTIDPSYDAQSKKHNKSRNDLRAEQRKAWNKVMGGL